MVDKNNGFTLIELLVIVAILSVLLVISAPITSKWRQQASMKETCRDIAAVLGQARSLAITEHWEHRAEIDIAGKKYRITKGNLANGSTVWTQVVQEWSPLPPTVEIKGGENCDSSVAETQIWFMPDGTADWTSTNYICILENGGKKFRTGITSKSTGQAKIFRWNGSWVQ